MLSVFRNRIFLPIIALLFCVKNIQAQKITTYPLDSALNEISGLEVLNDTLLVALNDGGNGSDLFVLDLKGNIIKKVEVEDAKNEDWEDIARDGKFLYIGDIGNNLNKRKKLTIYRVKIEDVINDKKVESKKIEFKYKEQKSYPPVNDSLFYDSEGMTVIDDTVWLFTKNRATNSDGMSWVYRFPADPGEYKLKHDAEVYIGENGWMIDGITAVDNDGDLFYFLTYNRYIVKRWKGKSFEDVMEYEFDNLAQRESILIYNKNTIFVADEKNRIIGDVKLHMIRTDRD